MTKPGRNLLIIGCAIAGAALLTAGLTDIVQENLSATAAIFHVSLLDLHTWSAQGSPGTIPLVIQLLPWAFMLGGACLGAVFGLGFARLFGRTAK